MLTSTELRNELLALKADAARLLGTAGDEMLKASRERADTIAEQLKSALGELGQTLGERSSSKGWLWNARSPRSPALSQSASSSALP